MKIAVMQPYLFPYVGYFQLVNYVDKFVLYDDVTYIKGGHINRNTILRDGAKVRFTLPVSGASSNRLISDLQFLDSGTTALETIRHAYSGAPYFEPVFALISQVFTAADRSVTGRCEAALRAVFAYLDLDVVILRSSHLAYDRQRSAADRLIEITKTLGGTSYVNSIGGVDLYDSVYFSEHGCKLSFLEMGDVAYSQPSPEFVSHLSIIDIMMWCDKQNVKKALSQFRIN